jgi:hypothetical protein
MKKSLLIPFLCIAIVGVIAWLLLRNQSQNNSRGQTNGTTVVPTPPEMTVSDDLTATFEIYTNGTKRIFTQAMYLNQSPDAFIQNPDPSIVHIKKAGTTWANFFDTLPFTLTNECIVTGTKETFCTTEAKKLRFFLNSTENPDALDSKIQSGDTLRITYGN